MNQLNISDSLQGRGIYPQQQANHQNVANNNQAKTQATTSKANRLDALKAQMQSGKPVDLNSLADSMLNKGSVIDVQA